MISINRYINKKAMNVINFYSHNKQYGWMSNFYASPITINGIVYPTTEHYFQASKMTNVNDHNIVRNASTPHEAAKLGRTMKMRDDWSNARMNVMLLALITKFHQHPNLMKELKNTGKASLVEHTKNDNYWGDGGNGTGCNMLGKMLEYVRLNTWSDLDKLGYTFSHYSNGNIIYLKNDGHTITEFPDGTMQYN